MKPLVSAIVLNFRAPQLTVGCVTALQKQTLIQKMEVIVVDNHSQDDSIGVLRNRLSTFSNVRIVETANNVGYGKGNNAGARMAQGSYLLICNPDNVLEPTALERMVNTMERDPSIGILAPRLVHEDGTVRNSSRAFPSLLDIFVKRTFLRSLFPQRMRRFLKYTHHQTATDVDWVVGACFLIRKEDFELLGGFDPRFFLFFEDTDLCRRVWKTGKRVVYDPSVFATDRKQRLSGEGFWTIFFSKTGRIHLVSAVKYFWKWTVL